MRATTALLALAALSLVGACASGPGDARANNADYNRISKDCQARGGMLKPIPGAANANEALNYACEFRGTSPSKP